MDVDENDDQIKGENDEMMAMTAMTTKETRHIPHLIPLYGCPVLNEGGKNHDDDYHGVDMKRRKARTLSLDGREKER